MNKKDEILAFLASKYPESVTYTDLKIGVNYIGSRMHGAYLKDLIEQSIISMHGGYGEDYKYTYINKTPFMGDIEFNVEI